MENKTFKLNELAQKVILRQEKEQEKKSLKKDVGIVILVIGSVLFLFSLISSFFLNHEVKIALTSIRMGLSLASIFIGINLILKKKISIWLGLLAVFFLTIILSYILCIDCYIGTKWSIFVHIKNVLTSGIDYIVYDTYRSIGEYYG